MMKLTKKRIIGIVLVALISLGVLAISNTGIPLGKATLHYQGADIDLPFGEAMLMRIIFSFKFYDPGIGGCPFEEDISVSFGDTVYAIAKDDCPSAKNWSNSKFIVFNRLEFPQIVALFQKYFGETPID